MLYMALSGNILSRDLRYINGFDKQTTRQLDKFHMGRWNYFTQNSAYSSKNWNAV